MDVELPDRTVLVRGRVATSLLFLLFGTALGTWTSRIPAVKAGLRLFVAAGAAAVRPHRGPTRR